MGRASMLGKARTLARMINATYGVFKYGRDSREASDFLKGIRNDLKFEIVPAKEFKEEIDEDHTEEHDEESVEGSGEESSEETGDESREDFGDESGEESGEEPDEEPDEEPGEESDEESSEESDEESVDQLHRDLKDVRKLLKDPQCHVIVYRKRNYYQKKVQIVVAVRGTNLLSHADLKEDLKISFQHLHKNERLVKIDKLVRELIKRYGCESICLTGHSLGAAIAFIVARQLYLDDKEVEGHFFALPFMPLDRIIRKIGSILHYEMSVCGRIPTLLGLDKHLEKFMEELTEWSASFVSSRFDLAEDAKKEFNMLMSWHPHIYVQKFDVISNGYIEFFRDTSSSSGLSRSTAFLRRLGMGPSAILITSKAELGTITSHGIDHWIDVEPLHFEALQIITNLRQVRDFKEL